VSTANRQLGCCRINYLVSVTVAVVVLSGGLLDDPGHGGAGLQPFLVAIGYAATPPLRWATI
jgi:hypothetical protein